MCLQALLLVYFGHCVIWCLIGIGNVRGGRRRYEWPLLLSMTTLACYLLWLASYFTFSEYSDDLSSYQFGLLLVDMVFSSPSTCSW